MSKPNQNTKPNTTATAETALLKSTQRKQRVVDNTATQFKTTMTSYNGVMGERQTKQIEEGKLLTKAVMLSVQLFLNGAKPKDFMPEHKNKNGKVVKAGKFAGGIANKAQANKISAGGNNKKVKAAVKKAVEKAPAGTKVNQAIIGAVFEAKKWTSYSKLMKAVGENRAKELTPLTQDGLKAKAKAEQAIRDICNEFLVAHDDMNSDGLHETIASIDGFKKS